MYYKIRNNILFRQYRGYGYITDNSEFGYRFLNDARHFPGEKYVSESGAIMLATLSKTPRHIDDIVADLLQIFVGVKADTLKQDGVCAYVWKKYQKKISDGCASDYMRRWGLTCQRPVKRARKQDPRRL